MHNSNPDFSLQSWAKIASGKCYFQFPENVFFKEIVYDSRLIINPKDSVFIALKSKRNDGHQYIEKAIEKGIVNFVVSDLPKPEILKKGNFILVKNTLQALQLLAIEHRNQHKIPVIAITGSNGKTIVKEWLRTIASKDFNLIANPKSFNSQLGVPLSVLKIRKEHRIAIFEAGISQKGEMKMLEAVIQPVIGIFTNIGSAHAENFESLEEKIKEKLQLFKNCQTIIYCSDNEFLANKIETFFQNSKKKLLKWGTTDDAELKIYFKDISTNSCLIKATYQNKPVEINIPFTDFASFENAMHVWLCALYLAVPEEIITTEMQQLQALEMRLELKHALNNCLLINDSYSADIESLKIALEFAVQQKSHDQLTVILSDFQESGLDDAQLYSQIAEMLVQYKVKKVIGVGEKISAQALKFTIDAVFFPNADSLIRNINKLNFRKEIILLKGARSFHFEHIADRLEAKTHDTILEINLSAMLNNLNVYRSLLKPKVKTMAMVKAFSYGSGSYEVANLLEHHGIDYLAVAYVDEGIALREGGIQSPIMVMSTDVEQVDKLISYRLEPEIFSFRILHKMIDYLQKHDDSSVLGVHIKLDTGMHRLGFLSEEMESLIQVLQQNQHVLKVKSIFSHLTSSGDEKADEFTLKQIELFSQMSDKISAALDEKPMKHILNTSGISRFPDAQFDMVRLGIGLYGIGDASEEKRLQLVGRFTSTITQIKKLKKGDSIGYNRKCILKQDSVIATVAVGYADGLQRALGEEKYSLLVHGKAAPIMGSVCMDMCMIDITAIENVAEGDTVLIFENQTHVRKMAEIIQTIPYEILTGISARVKRVYYQE